MHQRPLENCGGIGSWEVDLLSSGASRSFRDTLNGGDDLVVRATAANVARHVRHDLRTRRRFVFRQKRRCLHDLPALAIATLRRLLNDPSFLQRVIAIVRQPFNRCYFFAYN